MSTSTAPTGIARSDTISPATHPAMAALVTAFAADPVIRWVLPDPVRYLAHFPELVTALSEGAFATGHIDSSGTGAAALWVPPGHSADDERLGELMQTAIEESRWDSAFAFLGQVEQYHPTDAHWYLPFIGVDPRAQGQGLGSELLSRGLARSDRDGLPTYLEASTPRNRRLYERHGFETIGEIQAGDSPTMWPMLRPAS